MMSSFPAVPTRAALIAFASRHRAATLALSMFSLWALAKGAQSLVLFIRRRSRRDPHDSLSANVDLIEGGSAYVHPDDSDDEVVGTSFGSPSATFSRGDTDILANEILLHHAHSNLDLFAHGKQAIELQSPLESGSPVASDSYYGGSPFGVMTLDSPAAASTGFTVGGLTPEIRIFNTALSTPDSRPAIDTNATEKIEDTKTILNALHTVVMVPGQAYDISLLAKKCFYKKGDVLFTAGDDSKDDGVFVIQKGSVGVYSSSAVRGSGSGDFFSDVDGSVSGAGVSEDILMCVFRENSTIGENNVLAGARLGDVNWARSHDTTRAVTAKALENTVVLRYSAVDFIKANSPGALVNMIFDANSRLWFVAKSLLSDYLCLADAWLFSLEPPGSAPAFVFDDAAHVAADANNSASPLFPPAVRIKRSRIEFEGGSNDISIHVFPDGGVVYKEGEKSDAVYVLLDGFAYTSVDAWPTLLSGKPMAEAGARLPASRRRAPATAAPADFPLDLLHERDTLRAKNVVRLLGAGSVSGGPSCFNNLPHMETLTAFGPGGLRVAVFSRQAFANVTSDSQQKFVRAGEKGAGGGGVGVGAAAPIGGGAVATPVRRGRDVSEVLGSPAPPPPPPDYFSSPLPAMPPIRGVSRSGMGGAVSAGVTDRDPASLNSLLLEVALSIARSNAPLPRLLLELGLKREWRDCYSELFSGSSAASDNCLFFIVSGRVRCTWNDASSGVEPSASVAASVGAHAAGASPLSVSSVRAVGARDRARPRNATLILDVGRGEIVGEQLGLFTAGEGGRAESAVTVRNCELIRISREAFALLESRYPSVHRHFTTLFARRSQALHRKVVAARSFGTPGLLGIEAGLGIPYSVDAPPLPLISLGSLRQSDSLRDTRLGKEFVFYPPSREPLPHERWRNPGRTRLIPCNPSAPSYRTIALVAAGQSDALTGKHPVSTDDIALFGRRLAVALARTENDSVALVTRRAVDDAWGVGTAEKIDLRFIKTRAAAWLASLEETHRFVVLVSDSPGGSSARTTAWTRFCVCQADFVLLLGDGDGAAGFSEDESALVYQRTRLRLGSAGGGAGDTAASPREGMGEDACVPASLDGLLTGATSPGATPGAIPHSPVAIGSGNIFGLRHASHGSNVTPPSVASSPAQAGGAREQFVLRQRTYARKDLVLLHASGGAPARTRNWLVERRLTSHHHCARLPVGADIPAGLQGGPVPHASKDTDDDVGRIARIICGRAVAVVLGGGGARGLAHVGLLETMNEKGVPIDIIGGVSQGSYVAAAWAKTCALSPTATIVKQLARAVASTWNFVTSLTLPLVSWTSGAHFDDVIHEALGSVQIEDLPGPRFFCVSLNVSDGAIAVHDRGPLWRYVRASMSVVRLLPPVYDRDQKKLLVDGGYASNLPVDVLHALVPGAVGLCVANDVENKESNKNWMDIDGDRDFGKGGSLQLSGFYVLWRMLLSYLGGPPMRIPWVDDMYLQISYLRHYAQLRSLLFDSGIDGAASEPKPLALAAAPGPGAPEGTKPGLLYIRPAVGHFTLLDYSRIDTLILLGREKSSETISGWETSHVVR